MTATGATRTLNTIGEGGLNDLRTWRVNAVNECRLCHNAAANHVLGFVPNQLEHTPKARRGESQVASLIARQVISEASSLVVSDPLKA